MAHMKSSWPLVRTDHLRTLLWEMDLVIQDIAAEYPGSPALKRLTGVYHNLLREWSDT